MRIRFITIFVVYLSLEAICQPGAVKVSSSRNDDKTVDFSFTKSAPGSFYVEITFNELGNAVHNGYRGVITGEKGKLFKLRPQDENSSISFNYSYRYLRGTPNPKFDEDFVYLMPFTGNAQVEDMSNLNVKYFGATGGKNWRAFMFKLTPGDTVYASRKGLVVEVINHHEPDTTNEYSYYPMVNTIVLEHPDGTFARYAGFSKEKNMVEVGETVFPNDPLGLIAQYDKQGIAQLRFNLYYLNYADRNEDINQTLSTQKDRNAYINPIFLTDDGAEKLVNRRTYISSKTDEIIQLEMTRKERKNRGLK